MSKCLDLTRDLKALKTSFNISFRLENSLVSFTSDAVKGDETLVKKKSPSQRLRDYQRKQIHLSKKAIKVNENDANPLENQSLNTSKNENVDNSVQNPKYKEEEKVKRCMKENCITCAIEKGIPETEAFKDSSEENTTEKECDKPHSNVSDSASTMKVKPKILQCKFCPKKISEGDDMAEHIKQMWPSHLDNIYKPPVQKKYF